MISIAPTGKLIIGTVLDCNKKHLEQKLKDYDSQLYVKWVPKLLGGWGAWEIWRHPDKKQWVEKAVLETGTLYSLEYVEIPIINHVLTVPYLNYDCLTKIKKMDTWGKGDFVGNLEYEEQQYKEKMATEFRNELRYNIKQHRREFKEMKELIASGVSPSRFIK